MGVFLAAAIPDMKRTMSLTIVGVMAFNLLAGFFVNKDNLKDWIRWARWISPIKYGM